MALKKKTPQGVMELIEELSSNGLPAMVGSDGRLRIGASWEAVLTLSGNAPPGPLLVSAYLDALKRSGESLKTPVAFYSGELLGMSDRIACLPAWAFARLAARP